MRAAGRQGVMQAVLHGPAVGQSVRAARLLPIRQAVALGESGIGPACTLYCCWRGWPYLMILGARLIARPNPKLLAHRGSSESGVWGNCNPAHPGLWSAGAPPLLQPPGFTT